jgi:hypothetical protein
VSACLRAESASSCCLDVGGELLLQMARSHCGNVRRDLFLRGRLTLRELEVQEFTMRVSVVHLSEAATKRVSAGEKSGELRLFCAEEVDQDVLVQVVDLDVLCGCQLVAERMSRLRAR